MIYDLIIIGAGPAGLSASIFASRYQLKHLLIGMAGGLASTAHLVANYPGYQAISGPELMEQFIGHAQKYGVEILPEKITGLKKQGKIFKIQTSSNKKFQAKTIIIATGSSRRKLGISGEKKFIGRGVSYCATCDGPLYKGKIVAVVGGGDAALTSALFLAKQSKKVYLIHRRKEFRAQAVWQIRVNQTKKIVQILGKKIEKINGNQVMREIILDSPKQGKKNLKIDGLFIETGQVPPDDAWLDLSVRPRKNKAGYIKTDYLARASVAGLFAAGDITGPTDKLRQIITAAAEGSVAATAASKFLAKKSSAKSK